MSEIQKLSWEQINNRAEEIAKKIKKQTDCPAIKLYGVPRGGIFAALKVLTNLSSYASIVETPDEADIIIDDIVDSGNTRHRYNSLYGMKPFYALVDKTGKDSNLRGAWISFPWERMGEAQEGPVDNVTRLIEYIGDDPNREGLKETPQRVVRSYETLFGGYKQNPEEIIKVFEDGSCNEMVLLRDVEFYSNCEHHMLPFFGYAHIAYIPDGRVIGVSKLARILEIYTRRLQIQERISEQVTECLMTHLKPKGAACVLQAQHLCMVCRGVEKQNAKMVTSSLKGVFLEDPRTRNEFFSMIGK